MFAGNLREAETDAREAIQLAEMTGNLWGQSYSRGVLAQTLIAIGRFGEAIAEATASIELGKRAGFSISQIWTPCVIAECLCELGQPERGFTVARGAIQAADSFLASWRGFPLAVAVICLAAAGDCAAADKAAEEARLAASTLDLSSLMYGVAAIEHARACGEPETLLQRVDDGIRRLQGFGFEIYHPALLTRKSEGHHMLGQFAQAESSARDALGTAQRTGSHRGLWRTWAALADALEAQGRDAEAREAIALAREEIVSTVEHAGSGDLRASFLSIPAVDKIMAVE
jgi:tetratricopeptide (TPR) repeat protein